LGIYIIVLFSIGFSFTYLNDYLQESGIFGDKACGDNPFCGGGLADREHEWGSRHYWYYWTCAALFIISLIRIVIWANEFWDKKEEE